VEAGWFLRFEREKVFASNFCVAMPRLGSVVGSLENGYGAGSRIADFDQVNSEADIPKQQKALVCRIGPFQRSVFRERYLQQKFLRLFNAAILAGEVHVAPTTRLYSLYLIFLLLSGWKCH